MNIVGNDAIDDALLNLARDQTIDAMTIYKAWKKLYIDAMTISETWKKLYLEKKAELKNAEAFIKICKDQIEEMDRERRELYEQIKNLSRRLITGELH